MSRHDDARGAAPGINHDQPSIPAPARPSSRRHTPPRQRPEIYRLRLLAAERGAEPHAVELRAASTLLGLHPTGIGYAALAGHILECDGAPYITLAGLREALIWAPEPEAA